MKYWDPLTDNLLMFDVPRPNLPGTTEAELQQISLDALAKYPHLSWYKSFLQSSKGIKLSPRNTKIILTASF